MSRQFWSEAITWLTADGTAVASTAAETILPGNITIPANYLQDGRSFRLRAFGKYSTTATPTMIFGLRWGGVAGTVASATGNALTTPMTNGGVVTPAVATIDATADTALSLTLTWSASSASNTATILNYYIEALN